tara:strand:+ start:1728 stop:2543 length:816 start_codon:yes stop_codon:yes gene_type:complete
MCLLIIQKKNSKVTDEQFKQTWKRNNDGVGYAFVDKGEIQIRKFMKLDPFVKSINKDVKKFGSSSAFLIHFRYTTHGLTNLDNCHPFRVNDGQVFGHNGCINSVGSDATLSDTRVFNNTILKDLPTNWSESESIKTLVSDFIGSSKLAFLNSDGSFEIINEHKYGGHWNKLKTIWYSNDNYKKPEPIVYHRNNWKAYNWDNTTIKTNKKSKKNRPIMDKIVDTKKRVYAENKFIKCDGCGMLNDSLISVNDEKYCDTCETYFNEQSEFKFD